MKRSSFLLFILLIYICSCIVNFILTDAITLRDNIIIMISGLIVLVLPLSIIGIMQLVSKRKETKKRNN